MLNILDSPLCCGYGNKDPSEVIHTEEVKSDNAYNLLF